MMLKALLYSLSLFFLFSCGGVSQYEPREIKTLYFKGSATNGLDYYCGERRGVTKTIQQNGTSVHGALTCTYMPIEFSLGSLFLGEVASIGDQKNIYPQSLVPSFDGDFNNKSLLKIAILLQSLDDKKHPDYLNISQETKEKITLKTLNNISIEELYKEIEKMGFTPVLADKAKLHLILHSENTNIGKPTIQYFEEDISTNMLLGSTIAKLVIGAGDGKLHYPFLLEGEGAEHFLLNDNAKLILIQSLEEERDYNLTVTATNEYGYTTQAINIHTIDGNKIGKAQMGRLKGARVELFKINEDGSKILVGTSTTKESGSLDQIGNFDLMTNLMDDHEFYLYELSGGVDIDVDNDHQKDKTPTPNQGKLHLLTKGIWIKNSMNKIRITPLSEILYTYIKHFEYTQLEEQLNEHATLLLQTSLNSDRRVDVQDVMIFDPSQDQDKLSETLSFEHTYQKISNKIRANDPSYTSDIFSAYIVDSFEANAIEIVGSTIYTVDMMKSGEFRIYDLESKKLIGKLKLPNTPVEEDSHVIYVNLTINEVNIASLENLTYEINIKEQKNLKIIDEPFLQFSILSGNFNRLALGKSNSKNLFTSNKNVYFYNIDNPSNKSLQIDFFTIDKSNKTYKYQFNSQLFSINSLWLYKQYLYVIGDKKIHIFQEKDKKMKLSSLYQDFDIQGDILGVEREVLYILKDKMLMLFDIKEPLQPKFIERIAVPFSYKLGIKTNGEYITTGSKIISIKALRASKNAM